MNMLLLMLRATSLAICALPRDGDYALMKNINIRDIVII